MLSLQIDVDKYISQVAKVNCKQENGKTIKVINVHYLSSKVKVVTLLSFSMTAPISNNFFLHGSNINSVAEPRRRVYYCFHCHFCV